MQRLLCALILPLLLGACVAFGRPADSLDAAARERRTRELVRGTRARLWFIHVNHTNAALDEQDVVREGMTFPM